MEHEFVSRYEALGMPLPDPATMCKGQCEGTGAYPQKLDDPTMTVTERNLWHAAHNAPNAHEADGGECDGWHFIKCPDCDGTGKAQEPKAA